MEQTNESTRRKIVLVDDVSFHLMSTKERLKKHYDVFPAQSGEELFELLEKVKPDLILLDVYLPGCDGFEIIKKLKEDIKFLDIPVIFLTSKNDKETVVGAMKSGAADLIKKPFIDAELIECIEYQFDVEIQEKNKPIILAIDDNASILTSVKQLLGNKYTIYTLPDSTRCEELIKMIAPDLFLLDCKMPKLSGFDLIPIIRKYQEHEETPIMFLTSENSLDTVSAAINFGACGYITKPIDNAILRDKVSSTLKDYILRRRLRKVK
ncbi:MAG: response regulator [Oscillospiraceae bacterium]|nr:response regulator [Oscillospiraceae bacterium]